MHIHTLLILCPILLHIKNRIMNIFMLIIYGYGILSGLILIQ